MVQSLLYHKCPNWGCTPSVYLTYGFLLKQNLWTLHTISRNLGVIYILPRKLHTTIKFFLHNGYACMSLNFHTYCQIHKSTLFVLRILYVSSFRLEGQNFHFPVITCVWPYCSGSFIVTASQSIRFILFTMSSRHL